jgi:hypothetical protein
MHILPVFSREKSWFFYSILRHRIIGAFNGKDTELLAHLMAKTQNYWRI